MSLAICCPRSAISSPMSVITAALALTSPHPWSMPEHQRDIYPLRYLLYSLTCVPTGGQTWILMGSLHQTMATVERHFATIISEPNWNTRTVTVLKSHSIPCGCTWPSTMHNLTTPSSWKELGGNGVPSPWVTARMHMQLAILSSSPRVRSLAAKAVAVDAVDILKWGKWTSQCMWGGDRAWDVILRKILQLTTAV